MPAFVVPNKTSAQTARLMRSLLAFLLWGAISGARADVIDNCSEASLRAAAANGGSYTFNCGTNTTTIILSNTIVVTADLTLDGAGQDLLINGGNSVRLFMVNSNVHLTLKNLVLTNGKAAGAGGTNGAAGGNAAGGAIYNDAGSVALINSTLSGHAADGGNGGNGVVQLNGNGGKGGNGGNASGGAIFNNAGSLWLTNCTFAANSGNGGAGGQGADAAVGGNGNNGGNAGNGGGASGAAVASVGGTVVIYDCTFSNNGVTGAIGGSGGKGTGLGLNGANGTPGAGLGSGLFNDGGTATVLFSTLDRNTANGANGGDGKPGAGDANGASGAAGAPASGAGICNNGGALWMTNCTFFANTVVGGNGGNGGDGGAFGFGGDGGDGGSGGPGNGGAVFNAAGGRITAVNCTVSDNSAQGGLGGSGGAAGSIVSKAGRSGASGANYGGGLAAGGGMFALQNTLVGGSLSGDNAAGAFVDGGYNLSDDNSLALIAAGSKTAPDLLLGLLSSNGGPTQTVPLRSNSPAINAGNDAYCLPTDQRHYARSGPCDIGAYELNATDPNATLSILLQTNQVVFTWPTSSIGYTLQFTPGLSPAAWTAVTNTPAVVGNQYVITNTVSTSNRFYRLTR